MKGWKTLAFNAAVALVGVVQSADWIDLLGSRNAGYAVLATAVANAVLRTLTTTPIGRSAPPAG